MCVQAVRQDSCNNQAVASRQLLQKSTRPADLLQRLILQPSSHTQLCTLQVVQQLLQPSSHTQRLTHPHHRAKTLPANIYLPQH
jgi:hypothetical protein